MNNQQQQTTTPAYVGVSGKTRKQRDNQIKQHLAQVQKELAKTKEAF